MIIENKIAENLGISGIVMVFVGIILCIPYVVYYFTPIIIPPKVITIPPQFWIGITGLFICIVGVALIAVGTQGGPVMGGGNFISGENMTINSPIENFCLESTQQVYQNIGYGPLVSKSHIDKWLSGGYAGSSPGKSFWKDPNSDTIELPSEAFKSIWGFIPPSFEYFPEGQDTNLYNGENYEVGREKCMQACTLTNCAAVQTEVPQNCYHQTIQLDKATGAGEYPTQSEYTNACKGSSTHACTLFYKTIKEADDGYWRINNTFGGGITGGCTGTNSNGDNLIGCLGKKYYEDTDPALPMVSPTYLGEMPSNSLVKWCDSSVIAPNTGSMYSGPNCTCTTEDNCTDPGCCRWRNLLTTEAMMSSKPYFNLPLAIETSDNSSGITWSKLVKAVNINETGVRECCGLCPPDSYFSSMLLIPGSSEWNLAQNTNSVDDTLKVLKSCSVHKCSGPADKNCWVVDKNAPESAGLTTETGRYCDGDLFEKDVYANNSFSKFTEFFNQSLKNYDPLMSSCFYRQAAAVPAVQQFNCPTDTVERGCFGSPPIISIEELKGPSGACSNDSIIPQESRCILQKDSKGRPINKLCEGFPYACGTQFGSNRLWIPT